MNSCTNAHRQAGRQAGRQTDRTFPVQTENKREQKGAGGDNNSQERKEGQAGSYSHAKRNLVRGAVFVKRDAKHLGWGIVEVNGIRWGSCVCAWVWVLEPSLWYLLQLLLIVTVTLACTQPLSNLLLARSDHWPERMQSGSLAPMAETKACCLPPPVTQHSRSVTRTSCP